MTTQILNRFENEYIMRGVEKLAQSAKFVRMKAQIAQTQQEVREALAPDPEIMSKPTTF